MDQLPDLSLYWVHVGFWASFGIALLFSRSANKKKEPAADTALRAGQEDSAKHSRAMVWIHAFGFVAMYLGIGAAIFGLKGQGLFAAQPIAGLIVIALGALLQCWALLYFRSWRFRATVTVGHELATGGPFRFLRHPIYMAFNLLALGSALWFPTPILWAAFVLMVAGADVRARGEEVLLKRTFGDAYATYCGRTARFVPGVY